MKNSKEIGHSYYDCKYNYHSTCPACKAIKIENFDSEIMKNNNGVLKGLFKAFFPVIAMIISFIVVPSPFGFMLELAVLYLQLTNYFYE